MESVVDVETDAPKSKKGDKAILKEARKRFDACINAEEKEREHALDDLKFAFDIDGYQWPDDIRRARGQRPTHTNNRMLQFINHVVNEQKKSRPAIIVSPIGDGADVKTAQIYQGLIRNIERCSRAEVAYDTAFMYAVACGRGFFRICTEYCDDDSFDQDIRIKLIENPFSVYTDPDHEEPDGIDAKFRFVTEKMKRDAFEEKYGFEATPIDEMGKGDDNSNWFDDDSVRVAEYWRIVESEEDVSLLSNGETVDGILDDEEQMVLQQHVGAYVVQTRKRCKKKVEQYLMTGDQIIQKSEWAGKYIPVITVCGGVVNVEGKKHRYSLIRYAKDAQRLDNYWSSTEAELLALQTKTPFIGVEGQFEGHESQWAKANQVNLPYLEYVNVPGAPPPQRQGFVGTPTGVREARMAAIEDVKAIMGLFDASLGARSNEVSGVAIRERRNQGDTATYHFIDAMAKSIESAGRIIIDLVPKTYDTARVVRIVKPDEQSEMVAINQIFIDPKTGQPYKYDLCAGTYDVAVKVGPSFQTQREESRESQLEFLRMYPNAAPVIGDLLVSNMDWPNSEQIAQRLKAMIPPQALGQHPPQPPNPMQMIEQAKLQQIQQKGQMDLQKKQMEMQAAQQKHDIAVQQSQAELQGKDMDRQTAAQTAQAKAAEHAMEMQLKQQQQQIEMLMAHNKLVMQQLDMRMKHDEAMRNDQLYMQRLQMQPAPPHGPPQTQF